MDNKITTMELSIEECELIRKALVAYDSSAKHLLRYGDWLRLRAKLSSIYERIDAWRMCDDEGLEELIENLDYIFLSLTDRQGELVMRGLASYMSETLSDPDYDDDLKAIIDQLPEHIRNFEKR